MKHKFLLIYCHFIRLFTSILPDSPSVMKFRGKLYSIFMPYCGGNFQVATGVIIKGLELIKVGENVYIGPASQCIIRKGIDIGDDVLIGPNCILVDGNHGFDGKSYRYKTGREGAIIIGAGVWLSANCVVTCNTIIGSGTLVGANSVVRGKLEAYSKYVTSAPLVKLN